MLTLNKKYNATSVLILSATILLIGVAIKLFYIFLITKREGFAFNLGYPYDAYLFDPFHRFTDWLVPLAYSKISNPWDTTSDLAKMLPPVPYGPTTFIYLKVTSFLGSFQPFLLMLLGYLYFNFKILRHALIKDDISLVALIFMALLIGFYPLHYLIDRGNTVIIGAFLISFIFYIVLTKFNKNLVSDKKYIWLLEFLFVLLLTTKPSWGLCVFPVLFISRSSFIRIIFGSSLIYLLPLLVMDVTINDYLSSIKTTYAILQGTVFFSHDIVAGASILSTILFNFSLDLNYLLSYSTCLGIFLLVAGYFYINKSKLIPKNIKFLLYLSHTLILTCLFNRPSPDYNLIILFPVFITFIILSDVGGVLKKHAAIALSFSFFFISSWGFIIGQSSQIQYWIPLRTAGVIFFDIYIIYLLIRGDYE